MNKTINFILFLGITLFIVYLLFIERISFFVLEPNSVPYVNIIIGLLLCIRYIRLFPALPLIWGYSSYSIKNKRFLFLAFNWLLVISSICLFFENTTIYAALFLYISNTFLVIQSKYYSIEDIYFQNTLFHLSLLNLALYFMPNALNLAALSFFIGNGIIMFSAGYEKLKSELWRKGNGAISFLGLPHLVRKQFHFISKETRIKPLLVILGYLIVFSESTFIFSVTYHYWYYFNLLVLIGFSISLFIIVDISFIGQVLALNLIFCLLVFSTGEQVVEVDLALSSFLFIIHLLGVVTVIYYPFALKLNLQKVQKVFTGINSPIGVFNERHQFGFYTYRILNAEGKEVLNAFCELGYPSKYQFWYPRMFQSLMYPVTDFCLSITKYGVPNQIKKNQIIDALYCAYVSQKNKDDTFTLLVKKYDEGDSITSYTSERWVTICKANFYNGKIDIFQLLENPPQIKKTYRSI